jgi:hypothetical protein
MSNLPKPMGLYPMTRKAGGLIFVSGMGPREAGTDNIPDWYWINMATIKALTLKHRYILFLRMSK